MPQTYGKMSIKKLMHTYSDAHHPLISLRSSLTYGLLLQCSMLSYRLFVGHKIHNGFVYLFILDFEWHFREFFQLSWSHLYFFLHLNAEMSVQDMSSITLNNIHLSSTILTQTWLEHRSTLPVWKEDGISLFQTHCSLLSWLIIIQRSHLEASDSALWGSKTE